jgi:hypothetical protein
MEDAAAFERLINLEMKFMVLKMDHLSNIEKIVRQGDYEAIVTLREFPFDWACIKKDIQDELGVKVEDSFRVLYSKKVLVTIKGAKRKCKKHRK